MRLKDIKMKPSEETSILVVDDEPGVIDSLTVVLERHGYRITGTTNPVEAVELARTGQFELLVLDFLMSPIHGDEVVRRIRLFNRDMYILLLTGHKDLAPPLQTIRSLDIQGYCEKSDRFDQLILLVESGVKSIGQVKAVKKLKDGLNSILQSVPKIYQLQPIGNMLEDILSEIIPIINCESAFIIIDDIFDLYEYAQNENHTIYRGIGRFGRGIAPLFEDAGHELWQNIGKARMAGESIVGADSIIVPLLDERRSSLGVLYIEGRGVAQSTELIQIYASQAASSLNNAFLHSLVNTKNDELNKTYNLLKSRYMETVEALRLVVDAKDFYTRGHSDRVAYYSFCVGKAMGLTSDELESLRIGGLFHDVGKIGTADDILLKSVPLSEREYEEIKKHPLKGAQILSAVSMFRDIVPLIKQHHERPDGTGYPEGLKDGQIHPLARIITVTDCFDAMMSDRTYRKRLTLDEAIEQLRLGAGKQFDPAVVKIFVELLNDYDHLHTEAEAEIDRILLIK